MDLLFLGILGLAAIGIGVMVGLIISLSIISGDYNV